MSATYIICLDTVGYRAKHTLFTTIVIQYSYHIPTWECGNDSVEVGNVQPSLAFLGSNMRSDLLVCCDVIYSAKFRSGRREYADGCLPVHVMILLFWQMLKWVYAMNDKYTINDVRIGH